MRKKANKMSLRQTFASRSVRAGSYSLAVCAVALVIVVLVNLIAGTLPSKVTEFDISSNALYSLSDYSEQIAEKIDTDVTVYHLTTKAGEDARLSSLLRRYADLNDHIRVETRDPQVSQIASKYTTEEVSENSLIFVSEKRFKVVDYNTILTYSQNAQMYAMYGQNVSPDEFNGEREITSALDFVTTDVLPKVYVLTGHGEYELAASVQASVASANIEMAELDLTKDKSIPEDCACLLILAPDSDLAPQELAEIEAYWADGGKLMLALLIPSELKGKTPNYDALLADLGLESGDGFVIEADNTMYYPYPNYLIPKLQSHEITDPIIESKYHVYFPYVREMYTSAKHRGSLEITPLMSTSDEAFARSDMENPSGEKAEGDVDGPFDVAFAVTEELDHSSASAVVFATPIFLDESFASYSGNLSLFLNSLKWMCALEENISVVETKSLADSGSLEVASTAFMVWGSVLTLVVPLVVLVTGIVIFVKRKKR